MTLLPVFVALVVVWIAVRGLLTHPRLSLWAKTCLLCSAPCAVLAWLAIMTADDPFLFPETAPCPREPMQKGIYGDGQVSGLSTVFPPRAYCRWEDGTTYELAAGAELVFWVCFWLTVLWLAAGLWHAMRYPKALLR